MQSARKAETVTIKPTVLNTSTSIYDNDHMKGLYRGVTPRIGRRSAWLASLIMDEKLAEELKRFLTGNREAK